VEIDSGLQFDTEHEMELAASEVSSHTLIGSDKVTRVQGQQNFWSLCGRPITKAGNILSPSTSHDSIGRPIGSTSGFQEMMKEEQREDNEGITTGQC
jgi:hypothetical protein